MTIGLSASPGLLERLVDVGSPKDNAVGDEPADGQVLQQVAPSVGACEGGQTDLSEGGLIEGKGIAEDG